MRLRHSIRLIMQVATALVAGAVATIAVAWAIGMSSLARSNLNSGERAYADRAPDGRWFTWYRRPSFWGIRVVNCLEAYNAHVNGARIEHLLTSCSGALRELTPIRSPECGIEMNLPDPGVANFRAYTLLGLPAACVWAAQDESRAVPSSMPGRFSGTICLGRGETPWGLYGSPPERLLPIMPIWSGLAINSAVYGSLFFACGKGGAAMVRKLRRKPGQCRRCGYSLDGIPSGKPCPECGSVPTSRPSELL